MNADEKTADSPVRRGRRVTAVLFALGAFVLTVCGIYFNWEPWNVAWYERTFWPDNGIEVVDDNSELFAPSVPTFELAHVSIPVAEILFGGVMKDSIPALTDPKMSWVGEATYLADAERVIGIVAGGEARAYPLQILDYHEIINDDVNGIPVVVTYCPLCDSSAVFDRRTEIGKREFGVSGLLYNNNVLMYDRGGQPESLWSQVMASGVSGPANTKSLNALPLEVTTWKDWRSRHPDTKVVSIETGHDREYHSRPYADYFSVPNLMFPINVIDDRLPVKAPVLGVWTGDVFRAYPKTVFTASQTSVEDRLGEKKIVIEFNPDADSMRVTSADDGVHWMYSFWFAWYAMYPQTDVFER